MDRREKEVGKTLEFGLTEKLFAYEWKFLKGQKMAPEKSDLESGIPERKTPYRTG